LTEALKVADTKVGSHGEAERRPDAICVTTQWVYANCPKYIQTRVPETSGTDASHRGGSPGFVRFVDENTLELPDYSDNTMFHNVQYPGEQSR
jgi:hypothetical protein